MQKAGEIWSRSRETKPGLKERARPRFFSLYDSDLNSLTK